MENYDCTVLFKMKAEANEDFMQGDLDSIVELIGKYEKAMNVKFIEEDISKQEDIVYEVVYAYISDFVEDTEGQFCFIKNIDKIFEYVIKEFNKYEEAE